MSSTEVQRPPLEPLMECVGYTRTPSWERWCVYAVLCLYLVVQCNNVHNFAFAGQDFSAHVAITKKILEDPARWFYLESTDRPLLYWVGIACASFTRSRYTYDLASLIFVVLSAVSLFLLHASMVLFIKNPLFRISGLVFVTFLPATIISSVVFAADTVALLPFSLLVFLLSQIAAQTNPTRDLVFSGLATISFCIGILAKATFGLLPIGVALLLVIFWRLKLVSLRKLATIGVFTVIVPLLFVGLVQIGVARSLGDKPHRHVFDWHGTGEMTWGSLLLPRLSDKRILEAPGYWDAVVTEKGERVQPLIINNNYSYPALLVLGIFTDVLDFANYGNLDNGTPRPASHQRLAKMAVASGIVASLLMVAALVAEILSLWWVLQGRQKHNAVLAVWLVLALNWAIPLIIVLPFVHNAYKWGYWLPRLIIPAIWGVGVMLFASVDGLLAGCHRLIPVIILVFVTIQAIVHITSVWY